MSEPVPAPQSEPSIEQLIEFQTGDPARWPVPIPAARAVPQWLKETPGEVTSPNGRTVGSVKKCPPFLEAVTSGYLLPLPGDVLFRMEANGRLYFECQGPLVETQFPQQYDRSPFAGNVIVKFANPWAVRTPAGYSTLFLPPLNRFEIPFQLLAGVVETDTYFREVNLPSVCLMNPGDEVTLARGTPIAQLIPFRRQSWQSRTGGWDKGERLRVEHAFGDNPHLYKDEHWRRTPYT